MGSIEAGSSMAVLQLYPAALCACRELISCSCKAAQDAVCACNCSVLLPCV
jgi:hypothetical protein